MNLKKIDKRGCKIMCIPDLHLKAKEPRNRWNYVKESLEMFENIVDIALIEEVDIVILLGDVYDGEFKGSQANAINLKFMGMVSHLKDEGVRVFTLMGNHEKHTLQKDCPFFRLIDRDSVRIQEELKSSRYHLPKFTTTLLETTDELVINDELCIHMHHFSDNDKNYLTSRNEYKYNIGLFHDAILPSSARRHIKSISEVDIGQYSKVEYNDAMFENLNYAVCGDIHTKIGEMQVGECVVDIPGSVMRTQSGMAQSHESVDLPVFTLEENKLTKKHVNLKLWKYEDSFKVDVVAQEKKKRSNLKNLERNLEQVVVKRNFVDDIALFPNGVREVVQEVVTKGDYTIKCEEVVNQYIIDNRR